MTRRCTVCKHPQRNDIEIALLAREPYRDIAARFSLSTSSLSRHITDHLPKALAQAHEAQEVANASSLLDEVKSLQDRAMGILSEAEDAGDLRVALMAIKEVRSGMELMAKLMGQLDEGNKVTINIASEWPALRSRILEVLEPYPEAKTCLAAALEGYE